MRQQAATKILCLCLKRWFSARQNDRKKYQVGWVVLEVVSVLRETRQKLVRGRWFQKARTASEKGNTADIAGPIFGAVNRVKERELRNNAKAMQKDKFEVCQKEEDIQ